THRSGRPRTPAPPGAGPATSANVDTLLAPAATAAYAVLVAALLPCFTIYADVGTRLRAAGSAAAAADPAARSLVPTSA
ncbi:thiaminase II/PqqC family protein, partial [Clavibacter michiganensis]